MTPCARIGSSPCARSGPRNYRLFFTGQTSRLIGTWMTRIATGWLVYRLTRFRHSCSAWSVSAGQIPVFLLGPFAGVWVDRWDRHRALVFTQILSMLQSFALASLALTHRITSPTSSCSPVARHDQRLRHAGAPILRHPDGGTTRRPGQRHRAELFHGQCRAADRPSIAGVVIAAVGEGYCFLIDGISYLAVIVSLLSMRIVVQPRKSAPRVLHELREGWRYVSGFVPIRSILLHLALVSLVGCLTPC